MLDDILAIPDHLRDALWRVESARLESARLERRQSGGLLVCGMGGSAIGGDLAAAVLEDRLERPMLVSRGYRLPNWLTADWSILCSSFSGGTEETLACFSEAKRLGAPCIVASTGGKLVEGAREAGDPVIGLPSLLSAPRLAIAYGFVCAAEVAASVDVAPGVRDEIEGAAAFLEEQRDALRHTADEIAGALANAVAVVYGAELTAAVARRWKTQINENAKGAAFFSELPEANHNEICAWNADVVRETRLAAILLEDRDQHPRVARRFDLTAEAIESSGATAVRVEVAGETRTERLLWAVMLGDLASLALAEARGVDPLAIEAIDRLKASLGSA